MICNVEACCRRCKDTKESGVAGVGVGDGNVGVE